MKQSAFTPNPFYEAALAIARRKLSRDANPQLLRSPRLGTGGDFVNIFLWDTAFSVQWAKFHADEFPVADSLDNFYALQSPDGFISRESCPDGTSRWAPECPSAFAPPLLAWAELDLYEGGFITTRLPEVFPHLLAQYEYNKAHFRRPDGLYYTDMLGCGMDDMPRWNSVSDLTPEGGIPLTRESITAPGEELEKTYRWLRGIPHGVCDWNRQIGWCETSAQSAFFALCLARIAHIIGESGEEARMLAEHAELARLINTFCWDETDGWYYDVLNGAPVRRRHIGAFWTLLAEVAPADRAARLLERLRDPAEFNRPCGVPSLSAADPDYMTHGAYWRGPVWAPTSYMLLRGLDRYGEHALAVELAARLYHTAETLWKSTGTIWENYPPDQCATPSVTAKRDFCGWSALIPVTFLREYLQNGKARI